MLTQKQNESLTQIGPGTPMGELYRRYWQPIAGAAELNKEQTKQIKILGETLVLYRNKSGELGLIDDRCPHRGMSLACGVPEEDGIRCAYHGWLFDSNGRCMEQPAEPEESTFKERVRISGYEVKELGGLIFAYMGPAPAPLLPHFDVYVWDNCIRDIGFTEIPCNWLQIMENSLDGTHVEWLHGRFFDYVRELQGKGLSGFRKKHKKLGFDIFEYGIIKRRIMEGETEEVDGWQIGHPVVFPGTLRVGSEGRYQFQIRVPIDDENTRIWWYTVFRPKGGEASEQKEIPVFPVPYLDENGKFMKHTVEGQDIMAWVTQGKITDRTREHLGTSDKGVILYRQLLKEEAQKVANGQDPLGTIRDDTKNNIILLPQEEHTYYNTNVLEYLNNIPSFRYMPNQKEIIEMFEKAIKKTESSKS